jgi:hypothetical protein
MKYNYRLPLSREISNSINNECERVADIAGCYYGKIIVQYNSVAWKQGSYVITFSNKVLNRHTLLGGVFKLSRS